MKVELPNVTLVCVDTGCHDLTALAVNRTLDKCNFGDIKIFSDKQLPVPATTLFCEAKSGDEALRFLWYQVPKHINTSHFLIVQWDSWVLDQRLWKTEFLDYDYIGAPWHYCDGSDVGNGGFCIRSLKLAKFLAENPEKYPYQALEDQTICRDYVKELKERGFKWPDKALAADFSFEWVRRPGFFTFGFHDCRNFPLVLSHGEVAEVIKMMQNNPYVRGKGFVEVTTALMNSLGPDCGYLARRD